MWVLQDNNDHLIHPSVCLCARQCLHFVAGLLCQVTAERKKEQGQRRCARMCTYVHVCIRFAESSFWFDFTKRQKPASLTKYLYFTWFMRVVVYFSFHGSIIFFLVCFLNIFSNNSQKWVFVNTLRWKSWWRRPQCWVSFFSWCVDNLHILISTVSPSPDPFEAFVIFSIRHEIRRIDLHKRDYSLLVPGLRNTIALDFHFNHSLLYWTDVVEDKIYRGKLSESGGMLSHCQ